MGPRIHCSQLKPQISNASPSYYKTLFLTQLARSSEPTREEELIELLEKCPPGRADCYVYQSLVGDILEHLFTPPLNKPIPELSDKARTNRRDFIMPNYSDKGFWAFMREKYGADSAGCEHMLREQWLISQKMILVLNDDDVIEMLMAKSDGRLPEDVLGRKIEQFRLSM